MKCHVTRSTGAWYVLQLNLPSTNLAAGQAERFARFVGARSAGACSAGACSAGASKRGTVADAFVVVVVAAVVVVAVVVVAGGGKYTSSSVQLEYP